MRDLLGTRRTRPAEAGPHPIPRRRAPRIPREARGEPPRSNSVRAGVLPPQAVLRHLRLERVPREPEPARGLADLPARLGERPLDEVALEARHPRLEVVRVDGTLRLDGGGGAGLDAPRREERRLE